MTVEFTLTVIRPDQRPYVDALALEVLLRDFVVQLSDEEDDCGAEAVERVASVIAAVIERKGHIAI